MSSEVTSLIDRYCAVWNEPEPERRKALLESVWADGATYTDPRADTKGVDELLAHIATVRAGRPGAKIVRTTAVDVHHGIVRFGRGRWHAAARRHRHRLADARRRAHRAHHRFLRTDDADLTAAANVAKKSEGPPTPRCL